MPIDTHQVYSYLYPRDLLALARTCKRFRAFLLHRSNESLWRAARENVGNLPPCPQFMSAPAFLNLLFSTHCQVRTIRVACLNPDSKTDMPDDDSCVQNCGKSPVWKAMWAWFARYCPNCVIAL